MPHSKANNLEGALLPARTLIGYSIDLRGRLALSQADELIHASHGSSNSFAHRRKEEIERVAKANR